jgi:capsular polysaccharide biosynthesis protein
VPAVARRSDILTALRRYFEIVLLSAALAAAAAAAVSYRSATAYTGTATYLVPPGKVESLTINPFDAERLGRAYAVVIANDRLLLGVLGEKVKRSSDSVAERTTTISLANSSAIRVQYRGRDRDEVRTYFNALTDAVESPSPPTANLTAGTIRLLRVDDDIPKSGGGSWTAGLVGALCGLLIGSGIATSLHRANPRVRGARDLRDGRGPVVLDVDPAQRSTVEALAHRVADGVPPGSEIAVIGATDGAERRASALAPELATVESLDQPGRAPRWVAAAFGAGAERLAQRAARTVLVVIEGQRPDAVAERLSELRDLGVHEVVVAVMGRKAVAMAAPEPRVSTLGS